MKKIPTLFVRNAKTNLVINQVTEGCAWVGHGEGVATRKYDGTCCMVRDGKLYKRYEVKVGKTPPPDFEKVGEDNGKEQGWVPVTDKPEDRWHREAFEEGVWPDGTYELCGPKVQGNPEELFEHTLIPHGETKLSNVPRDYEGLKEYLRNQDMEGIVWWHPLGMKAKIKNKDFLDTLDADASLQQAVEQVCLADESDIREPYQRMTNKTKTLLTLADHGQDILISRSHARTILSGCECFKEVTLDFKGIDLISPSFADEMFRVYHHLHPEVEFFPINTNDQVSSMIRRVVKAR